MSLVAPTFSSRHVERIVFVRPIPVLGSSQRMDQFAATDGWVIEVTDYGVTISRPANPEQNIPETPAFSTFGVGYSVPAVEVGAPAPVVNVETAARVAAAAEHIAKHGIVTHDVVVDAPAAPVVTVPAIDGAKVAADMFPETPPHSSARRAARK